MKDAEFRHKLTLILISPICVVWSQAILQKITLMRAA